MKKLPCAPGGDEGGIRKRARSACLVALVAALLLAGCGHKLVATGGQHTVDVFPDEDTYKKIANMKNQGGVAGMLGGLGENLATQKVDDQTKVKVISSDDLGSQVEVIGGPAQGVKGFVPKQNVD
ncbi:MAG TPA: hypothetical protein VEJ86_10815 [Candidatus Binataceae bacterium]|nr:hypothetical protein [Candidatus Binataceae bacterium]